MSMSSTLGWRTLLMVPELLHEVVPRVWVGGWAALLNDCAALRQRVSGG